MDSAMALRMSEGGTADGACIGHSGRKHVAPGLVARGADECRSLHLRGGAMWDRSDIEHVIAALWALRLGRLIRGHVLDHVDPNRPS